MCVLYYTGNIMGHCRVSIARKIECLFCRYSGERETSDEPFSIKNTPYFWNTRTVVEDLCVVVPLCVYACLCVCVCVCVCLHVRVLGFRMVSFFYSYGVVLWEISTRQLPYAHLKFPEDIHQEIMDGNTPVFPPTTPYPYRHLAEKCMSDEPRTRPSFQQIFHELEGLQVLE